MTTHPRRPAEVFSLKRRASTANSAGLEYPSNYQVEEDILSRIRSLLLSRNVHWPPKTPCTSDETRDHKSEYYHTSDTSDQLEFSTAKNVTGSLARIESGSLSFPASPYLRSKRTTWKMEVNRRPSQPSIRVQKQSFRTTSSTNNISASLDETALHADLPCCPPCPPFTKKTFRPPRLVLRVKSTKKRDGNFRSCIDFTPKTSSVNNIPPENPDVPSYTPCDMPTTNSSEKTESSEQLSRKKVKTEPEDLGCFLAGCRPCHCKKHIPRSSQLLSPQEMDGTNSTDADVASDAAKLGLNEIAVRHHIKGQPEINQTLLGELRESRSITNQKGIGLLSGSPSQDSLTSSVSSLDVFPHVVQSQDMAAKADLSQSFTSIVTTNFYLPGAKSKTARAQDGVQLRRSEGSFSKHSGSLIVKPSVASLTRIAESAKSSDTSFRRNADFVRSKESDISLNSKVYSPSLRSGASKTVSIRHALLKPSILAGDLVDTGLAIPPVLTQGPVEALDVNVNEKNADERCNAKACSQTPGETTANESGNTQSEKSIILDQERIDVTAAFGHLTSLKKANDLVKSVKDRVIDTEEWLRNETVHDESSETTVQHSAAPAENLDPSDRMSKSIPSLKDLLAASDGSVCGPDPKKAACYLDSMIESPSKVSGTKTGKNTCCPGIVTEHPGFPVVDSLNTAYWGFPSSVKEAVQEAVQIAVCNAIQEIIVPPRSQQGQVSDAYRKLVGDSLADAAKNADDYLRRNSLWRELPSSIQGRSEDHLDVPVSAVTDQDPLTAGAVPKGDSFHIQKHKPSKIDNSESSGLTGNRPLGFESRENIGSLGVASSDNLETVPLQNVGDRLVENYKQVWKSSGDWNGLGKSRSSGYTAIPTRKSSKNRAVGSKDQTTRNSSVKEFPKDAQLQKRSVEKLRSRKSRAIHSESSLGSPKSFVFSEENKSIKYLPDTDINQNFVRKKPSIEGLGHRNTIHWLRELLSGSGLYEAKFTALPPSTRRDENSSTGRTRSQTAPSRPITELHLGATLNPNQPDSGRSNILDMGKSIGEEGIGIWSVGNGDQQTAAMTLAFTKTINDLESLLNEALVIARQAADKNESTHTPGLLERASAGLIGGRIGAGDGPYRSAQKRTDNSSSIESMHESFGSFSSSDSEHSAETKAEDGQHGCSIPQLRLKVPTVGMAVSTELTQTVQHDAEWSPSGRLLTPYPPGSTASFPEQSAGEKVCRGLSESESSSRNMDSCTDLHSVNIQDGNYFLTDNIELGPVRSLEYSAGVSPAKNGRTTNAQMSRMTASCIFEELDFGRDDVKTIPRQLSMPPISPRGVSTSKPKQRRATQANPGIIKANFSSETVPRKRKVCGYIKASHNPPIQPRTSSLNLRKDTKNEQVRSQQVEPVLTGHSYPWQNIDQNETEPSSQEEVSDPARTDSLAKAGFIHHRGSSITQSFDGSHPSDGTHFDTGHAHRQHGMEATNSGGGHEAVELRDSPGPNLPQLSQRGGKSSHLFKLEGKNHVSLRSEHHNGFSFARTHKKPKIARDWAPARKRFVASIACISTALVGMLVGIYAAEVPAIQYWIVDFHHYTILGNVFFFIGLSIPTFFFWPLPLLHGRKPYTLGAMSLAMPLLFPQALAVGQFRSPYVDYWRVGLVMPRALMGFVLGFANMNFKSTLTDLFGASLQSENPHQEVVDANDVRRHGGGLGVWLSIWTWCAMGSIGVGFLIGAMIINRYNPAWGFYISIAIIAGVLFLNVLCPEVRRSAFRRSVAEMKHEDGISRRLGRGEVKMHMVQTGPKWWGEEFQYGVMLNARMLRQPGFMVLAIYVSWIYGQVVLIVVLLGSLTSKYYKFTSPYVGASVMAVPIGAFLAIPFQKASLFSRSRGNVEAGDDNAETLNQKLTLSSHLVRRAIFILVLPFAGLGYTLSSNGPPIPFIVPILMAGLIGFLSNLAMGECHGIIMETFDTSDLQPGMTGRPRGSSGDKTANKRTNYSSFPRVSSGFAITQGIGYLFAAIATGVGGVAERHIGQQAATGIMAGILFILSLLLLGVLFRFRDVQIIPNSKQEDMQKWKNARRTSAILRAEGIEQPEAWRPVIIGNPTHTMRRMCILEMGGMTRWSEIRRKNLLIDSNTLEAKHPNLAVIRDVEYRIKAAEEEIIHHVRRSISRHSLSRNSSRRSKRSDRSNDQPGDLGGHRKMLHPSGNGGRKNERGESRITE